MTYIKDPTYWMTNHDWFTGDMDKPREIRLTDKAPDRASEAGVVIKNNKFMREVLFGYGSFEN